MYTNRIKRLMCGQRRPNYLTVGGRTSHRARKVKGYVQSLQGKLRLFILPPYSPEPNPGELVWNDVRNNATGRALVHGSADLMRAVVAVAWVICRTLRRSPVRSLNIQRLAVGYMHGL